MTNPQKGGDLHAKTAIIAKQLVSGIHPLYQTRIGRLKIDYFRV